MNLVLGLSTQFRNFSMQTIDDLSFYFHEGFELLFYSRPKQASQKSL